MTCTVLNGGPASKHPRQPLCPNICTRRHSRPTISATASAKLLYPVRPVYYSSFQPHHWDRPCCSHFPNRPTSGKGRNSLPAWHTDLSFIPLGVPSRNPISPQPYLGTLQPNPLDILIQFIVPARMRFQVLFNPTSGYFSTFLHSTCILSVFSRYLALEGRYLPLYTAISYSMTRRYTKQASD